MDKQFDLEFRASESIKAALFTVNAVIESTRDKSNPFFHSQEPLRMENVVRTMYQHLKNNILEEDAEVYRLAVKWFEDFSKCISSSKSCVEEDEEDGGVAKYLTETCRGAGTGIRFDSSVPLRKRNVVIVDSREEICRVGLQAVSMLAIMNYLKLWTCLQACMDRRMFSTIKDPATSEVRRANLSNSTTQAAISDFMGMLISGSLRRKKTTESAKSILHSVTHSWFEKWQPGKTKKKRKQSRSSPYERDIRKMADAIRPSS